MMEATKSMLHDQYITMHLWEEAVRTSTYVQNISPHCVLDNKTPEEISSREHGSYNIIPSWTWEVLQYAEKYGAPNGTSIETKRLIPYSSYVALLCDIIDKQLSN